MRTLFKLTLAVVIVIFSACSEEISVLPQPLNGHTNEVAVEPPPASKGEFSIPESFSCKNVLIDASHDGGVWWFPQASNFNATLDHQGKVFAELLRAKGFRVDEMPRNRKVSDEILQNYAVIIRASGFEKYDDSEVAAYNKRLEDGVTLLLLSDHTKFDASDEIAGLLNVQFSGVIDGTISKFEDHPLTKQLTSLQYMVGSAVTNVEQNPNIVPVGWLSDGSVVMAKYKHEKSQIFLMGDVNTLEFIPQPFVENLASWVDMDCSSR